MVNTKYRIVVTLVVQVGKVKIGGACSDYVDVILTKKQEKLLINLVNYAGPHSVSAVRSYGQIPPLTDVTLEVALKNKPSAVFSAPESHALEWTWEGGKLTAKLDRLDMHTAIVIEP